MAQAEPATLLEALSRTAERHPQRDALLQGSVAVSYEDLMVRIAGAAARLRDAGAGAGDRVLLSAPNSPAVPILYFAIHAIGATATVVAPDMPPANLKAVAELAAAKLALLEGVEVAIGCPILPAAEVAAERASTPVIAPNAQAAADLLFTSGTTGKKKGVLLSHANVTAAARNISTFLDLRSDDIQAVPLPLSHSFGLGCVRSMAWTGHTLLVERNLVNPAAMLKRMANRSSTGLAVVPSGLGVIRRMTADALGELRDGLRFIELGSAPISEELRSWLMAMLPNTRLCHHYGMTEASRAAFIEYHADAHKPGSVGRASPGVGIEIRDSEGQLLPTGEIGEIVIRGGMVMSGYWRDPEITRARLRPYGLATGDLGRLDEDGYLYLLGRSDDVINVGGRKVAPEEVEDILRQHPAVEDAVCIASPDPVLGQVVEAHLVRAGAVEDTDLMAWLRPQLEDYKLPRAFREIALVPRTESGKIQRHLVKDD